MALEELQNGRYHRLRLLGSGGMGEVYLMKDMRVNRQVAIKVIRSEGAAYPDSDVARDAARLFQREARAIAALEHPNILPLYDFGEEILEGTTITYMVMPFSTEGTLVGWLRQRGSTNMLSLQDIAHVVEQAADALQYAHDHDVIHLDVKPSNFLLRSNPKKPNRPTLLLADFGIARNSATASSSSRTVRGTPTSMAPEQWSSKPVPATDQYALAVMAYELLTGRPPFTGSMEQLMYQHFSTEAPPPSTFNPQLPAAIDSVILRALAKKPEDRFPSISAFASAFEQAVQVSPDQLVLRPQQSSAGDFTDDLRTTLAISEAEASSGISRLITLPGGQHVNVTVPAGVSDGQVIHVQGSEDSSGPTIGVLLTIAIKEPEQEAPPSKEPKSDAISVASAEQPRHTPHLVLKEPSDPVSDHNLPTVASSSPKLQVSEGQQQPPLAKKRPLPLFRLVSILSVLIVLLLVATSVYFYNSHQAEVNATAHSQTATVPAKVVQTPTPLPTPTPTLIPTPRPQKGLYIAGTYKGSMTDQITNQTTYITLLIGQTQGYAPLSGYLVRDSRQYPLKGTADTQGNFSLTVQISGGQPSLYFHGTFQQDYLNGHYCSSNTNSCPVDTGYFSAGPRL